VWIAVLGSVKIFPNLEAALKGVFNRVLNFFPNASAYASFTVDSYGDVNMLMFRQEMEALFQSL
jgi:hypothetical protein